MLAALGSRRPACPRSRRPRRAARAPVAASGARHPARGAGRVGDRGTVARRGLGLAGFYGSLGPSLAGLIGALTLDDSRWRVAVRARGQRRGDGARVPPRRAAEVRARGDGARDRRGAGRAVVAVVADVAPGSSSAPRLPARVSVAASRAACGRSCRWPGRRNAPASSRSPTSICYLAMGLPAILAGFLVVHSTVTDRPGVRGRRDRPRGDHCRRTAAERPALRTPAARVTAASARSIGRHMSHAQTRSPRPSARPASACSTPPTSCSTPRGCSRSGSTA